MAAVVAIITSVVVANAAQTFATPNAAFITYNLAPGASSAEITPATSRSVLVMGCCTTANFEGVGQVSLLHSPIRYMTWVGLEPGNTITGGFSIGGGSHIVYLDKTHLVDIQVASRDTILIHSSNSNNSATLAGNVTLIW